MARLLLVLAAVASAASVAAAAGAPAKLPTNIKTCKQTDDKYKDCLKDALQNALPTLVQGIPELDMQPVDPLRIVKLQISQEKGRPVAINLEFTDLNIVGIGKVIIDSFEMEPGSNDIKISSHVPDFISLVGNYKVDGKVLVLPITGQGTCNFTLSHLMADLVLKGAPLDKGGRRHLDVKDFKFLFNTDRLYMHFENLFNGDKQLGENMNKFLNENWEEILKELKPAIQEALALAFLDTSNKLFHKVAYEDIFPPK